MAIGVIVAGQVYWLLLPFVLFYLTVYYPVMRAEEQELLGGYGEEVRDPGFQHPAQRVEPGPGEAQIEHHVEPVAPLPIACGVFLA